MFRLFPFAVALLLAFMVVSCGGDSTTGGLKDVQGTGVSDQEIADYVAAGDMAYTPTPSTDLSLGAPPVLPTSMTETTGRTASTAGKGDKPSKKCKKHGRKNCWKDDCKKSKCSKCDCYGCHKKDKCDKEPPQCKCIGICNFTERFWSVCDCDGDCVDICYAAKVIFEECECRNCTKAGVEVIFSRDGVEIGRSTTNKDGWAYFTEECVDLGSYVSTVSACDCFSADIRVVAYNNCNMHGCISGKGKLKGLNGKYMSFNYELHVNDGHNVPNQFTLSDGPNINFAGVPLTWLVIVGKEAHFGNGEVYMRAVDLGKLPGQDYVSVDVWGQNYHNEGNLLNGQIRLSYGFFKTPVAIP
jgi:hypothetical protein